MKKGNSALIMMGVIFAGVGLLFFAIGAWIGFFIDRNSPSLQTDNPVGMGIFMMLFSSIFIAVGVWQIVKQVKSIAKGKRLLEEGRMYWAEVSNINQNTSVKINGRSPYYVECWCEDEMGMCRNFVSDEVMQLPSMLSFGAKVAVFVNPDDSEEYYVDLSKFQPAPPQNMQGMYANNGMYVNGGMYGNGMNNNTYNNGMYGNDMYNNSNDNNYYHE